MLRRGKTMLGLLAASIAGGCDSQAAAVCALCRGSADAHRPIDLAALFPPIDGAPATAILPTDGPVLLACPAASPRDDDALAIVTAERVSSDRGVYYWLFASRHRVDAALAPGGMRLDARGANRAGLATAVRLLVERRISSSGAQLTRARWDLIGIAGGIAVVQQFVGSQVSPRTVAGMTRVGRGVAQLAVEGRLLLAEVDGNTWTLDYCAEPTRSDLEPPMPWMQANARRAIAGQPPLIW